MHKDLMSGFLAVVAMTVTSLLEATIVERWRCLPENYKVLLFPSNFESRWSSVTAELLKIRAMAMGAGFCDCGRSLVNKIQARLSMMSRRKPASRVNGPTKINEGLDKATPRFTLSDSKRGESTKISSLPHHKG